MIYFNSTVKKFLNQPYHNKPLISTVLKQTVYVQLRFISTNSADKTIGMTKLNAQ